MGNERLLPISIFHIHLRMVLDPCKLWHGSVGMRQFNEIKEIEKGQRDPKDQTYFPLALHRTENDCSSIASKTFGSDTIVGGI